MHRLILGLTESDPRLGDHRYHNTLDNRRSELRITDYTGNARNRRKIRATANRYKGYSLHQGRFETRIVVSGETKILGYFNTEEDAARAYDLAALKHFGEFSCLNGVR